ncbi:unnamed protein product, partial [Bubo scandiacus]
SPEQRRSGRSGPCGNHWSSKWVRKSRSVSFFRGGGGGRAAGIRVVLWRALSGGRRPSQTRWRPPAVAATGGGKGRDKHRVRKDPQGKRARQEKRRKSGQQVEEREGRSGQSAA